MAEVLQGVRVLDLSWGLAGAVGTMVLGDFGAEVIKVEPPGGDPFRGVPAALLWDRGKKSVTLDLKSRSGSRQFRELAAASDAVVEGFRPGVMERLGLGYDSLREDNPRLVYASLTGFGPKGPYAQVKGYEGAVAARSGRMNAFEWQKGREGPFYPAVNVASHAAALALARGVVAALYVRDRTGVGQRVETSLLQAVTPYDLSSWILWQMMIKDPEHFPGDAAADPRRKPTLTYLPARTKDGRWIQLANLLPHLFRESLKGIGLGDVLEDPRFAKAPVFTEENREILRVMMLNRLQERTLDEWMDHFVHHAKDVAAEPFQDTQAGLSHPQFVHNGHAQEVQDPRVGRMQQVGVLAKLEATPGSVKGPAPKPGEHTAEVVAALRRPVASPPGPLSTSPFASLEGRRGEGVPMPRHPLEGVTVLDLATVIAGPMGCSLLAELGARVIRIEQHDSDWMRRNLRGISAMRTMAGTEDISLDLKTPEGSRILHQLVGKTDVLVHNMRPGAPERLGIGYRQLRENHPRLVYLYVGGYGATGPSSHRPAMHPIPGALMGGALSQMGRGGLPPADQPMTMDEVQEISRQLSRANESNPDPNTSMAVATSAMLALYARERFGMGQYLEVTMLNANAYANAIDAFWYEGKPPRRLMDRDGFGLNALYRLYQARKGWVFLACPFDEEWRALCAAVGRKAWLTDLRFATKEARKANDEALAAELATLFATRTAPEWEAVLAAVDVCCVEAEDRTPYHFFASHPQVEANGFTTEVENPRHGTYWRYSPLINFSATPGKAGPGPLRGQQTRSILQELGYTDAQVDALKAKRVVDWEAVGKG